MGRLPLRKLDLRKQWLCLGGGQAYSSTSRALVQKREQDRLCPNPSARCQGPASGQWQEWIFCRRFQRLPSDRASHAATGSQDRDAQRAAQIVSNRVYASLGAGRGAARYGPRGQGSRAGQEQHGQIGRYPHHLRSQVADLYDVPRSDAGQQERHSPGSSRKPRWKFAVTRV